MGIQQNIQTKLCVPIAKILHSCQTTQNSIKMTILSIFDANQFANIVLQFIPAGIFLSAGEEAQHFNNYGSVWKLLKEVAKQVSIQIRHQQQLTNKFLQREKIDYQEEAIDDSTWTCLRIMCSILFQLMLKNQSVLYQITKMEEKYQVEIKQYIQNNYEESKLQNDSPILTKSKNKISSHHETDLMDKIYELEHSNALKDQQIAKAKQLLKDSKEQISTIKSVLHEKQAELSHMKKRIEAYAQADVLFQEKDSQILKLNKQLDNLKLKSHVKNTELSNEVAKLKQRLAELETEKNQILAINEELVSKNQMMMLNKQETDSTNKKVIANLKQKIKTLNERLTEQQKNLMDVLIEKQQKQKQIFQLEKKASLFDPIRKSKNNIRGQELKYSGRKSSKLVDELGEIAGLLQNEQNNLKYFQILFGDMSMRCTGELCIALRSQYVRLVQQILSINNDLESLQYITPNNRLDCILSQVAKIKESHQQNAKLKQKIVLLQSQGSKGTSKQSLQQINKLKKQLLVLKRNMQDLENKKKQQIQILIAALSEKFIADKKD